jgi:hypothetical protein
MGGGSGLIVLCIDGPAQGNVYDVEGHRFTALDPDMTVFVYHVHKFDLLGHWIRLGSVHLSVEDIDPELAFDAIASGKAKAAVIAPE